MATVAGGAPVFDNSYARLPERFFSRQPTDPVAEPHLIAFNESLAASLGFAPASRSASAWADVFAGNEPLPGVDPLAMAYAGHQFGNFVPQLGDGRALLLGEVVDRDGKRRDVQLKGAGRTPFSRQGDGRSALGPVLREYVLSEAMHALGIPTTRALAAVTTGEQVIRETPLPGGILTRVASSHVRVGTFQYFAAREDGEAVRRLADYVIDRHYPALKEADAPYLELLREFGRRQAQLVAGWLGVGFIHGVMNTDNVSIAGETIDFGPCAFMDEYDPATVFSSIDQMGRYAYGRQPAIASWNMARFAETLLGLLSDDQEQAVNLATEVLGEFGDMFEAEWLAVMGRKLGIADAAAGDGVIISGLLDLMQQANADFTLTFQALGECAGAGFDMAPLDGLISPSEGRDQWLEEWRQRIGADIDPTTIATAMRAANPVFIPRNHLVEQMINAAVEEGDFAPFERLGEVLADPFTDRDVDDWYRLPAAPDERVRQTFCGT